MKRPGGVMSISWLWLFVGGCLGCQFGRVVLPFAIEVFRPRHNQQSDSTVTAHDAYSVAPSTNPLP